MAIDNDMMANNFNNFPVEDDRSVRNSEVMAVICFYVASSCFYSFVVRVGYIF